MTITYNARGMTLIDPVNSNLSFKGYQHPLKTLFKKGQMPSVKFGLYGEPISPDNVSLEHLKPHSWGGKTEYANLALADKATNSARGSRPLADALSWEMLEAYLKQFNFRIKDKFNGYEYQEKVRQTCESLGVLNPKHSLIINADGSTEVVEKLPKKILRSMRNKAKKNNLDTVA